MGASSYKKQRADGRMDGLSPRERAALEEERKKRKSRVKYYIIGAFVVLVAAFVIFVNSRAFTNGLPALKVNDTDYTIADVNYQYQSAYTSFCNSYSSYLSYFLDTTTPLDEQACTIDSSYATWADYFRDSAERSLLQMTAYYDAALAAGYTVSEEDTAAVNGIIDSFRDYSAQTDYTLDGYLALYFGEGNNEKTVRAAMEKQELVSRYLTDQAASYSYTEDEKDAYYAENADSYDQVEYGYILITAAADEENGIDEAAAKATAADDAKAVLAEHAEGDLDAFKAACVSVTGQEATETSATVSSFLSQYPDVVAKADLTEGKTFSYDGDSGSYVVYVKGVETCDYPTVSVRHILVKAVDADGDGSYSDEERQTALDAVTAIRDEWLAGAADEDSFAALANEKSEDAGSNTNGGLYEDIYKGQMTESFDAFCFAGHASGDTDIVYGESSQYAGYHLIYFVGEGELYSRQLSDNAMRTEAYTAWSEELTAPYTATHGILWKYVG